MKGKCLLYRYDVLIGMVTRMFDQDCPIDGCLFKLRVEGKDASVKKIMNHVTEMHRLSDNILDQDYIVPCPLKTSCHETFTGRQWVEVSTKLLEHLRNVHSTWIDPDMCKDCQDRRIEDVRTEIRKGPKTGFTSARNNGDVTHDSTGSGQQVTAKRVDAIDDMTEFQYYTYVTEKYGPIVGEEMERKLEYRLFR